MAKFWGLILESGRRYIQKVDTGFCISMAVLESKGDAKDSAGADKAIKLFVERDKLEFLLCTLTPKACQLPLRIKFGKGETVALYFVGGAPSVRLHLSGYSFSDNLSLSRLSVPFEGQHQSILVKEPKSADKTKKRVSIKESPGPGLLDEMESSEDDSDDDMNGGLKMLTNGNELSSDDEESDDDDDESIEAFKKNLKPQLVESSETSDDDDGLELDDDSDDDSDEDSDEPKIVNQQSPESPSKKNKQQGAPAPSTPKPGDKRKSESAVLKTPENQNIKVKQPSSAGHTPMKFFSKGGVMCQDLKLGNGQPAKQGKVMTMYYSGRLKSNNKLFDANEKGPGFKFRLGKAEVIKGWDLGVEGMKVGGKRRLIIPANLAYGKRGAPPDIPPNATLVFDVELKNVS